MELLAEEAVRRKTCWRRLGRQKVQPGEILRRIWSYLSQHSVSEEAAGMTRSFVIGGENLLAENIRLWREYAPGDRLINEYGPTETVVGCCVYEVQARTPARLGPDSEGRLRTPSFTFWTSNCSRLDG